MDNLAPLAYFITWTVYGTHLQGDDGGWKRRRKGEQMPQPRLAQWHRERLNYSIQLLNTLQRQSVEQEIKRHCAIRNWHVWRANARSNHVHVLITASEHSGKQVRDQLKANCTRGIREQWREFADRPVWSAGGDWECINSEKDLQDVFAYVDEAQDKRDET